MDARPGITTPLRTVVIGAGNVASHLAPSLEAGGKVKVIAVWSRTEQHATELASRLSEARPYTNLEETPLDADLYLVSVVDDMIPRIAEVVKRNRGIWAHTSGTVEAETLSPLSQHYGVFYPLQTMSRDVDVDLLQAPFFIEGSSDEVEYLLIELAETISKQVYQANSDMRGKLHAAAVFACNFTNHMWTLADNILDRFLGLDVGVLKPLLQETLRKALVSRPVLVQTGPARRRDMGVIEHHIKILPKHEAEIYKMLSQSIIDTYDEFDKLRP